MVKISFDNSTFFYKDFFNMSHLKNEILEECFCIIKQKSDFDDYRICFKKNQDRNFLINYKPISYLDVICKHCIGKCIKIYKDKNIFYDKINIESWINVVRAKNPMQPIFKKNEIKFHTHTEICKNNNKFIPYFTFIYYIQMPNNLQSTDGVLFLEGNDKKVYHYLPKENDLIIMDAKIPHVPSPAYESTKDRIVLACNIGFESTK